MISLVVAAVLLLIHALVCLMLWTLMKLGLLPVRGHMLAVIVLVPLWGPLLVVLLSVRSAVFGEGLKESALESLRFNDDLHRSILVHERDADAGGYQGHVIPIVIACAILAFLEKRLHKVVPEMFDLFVTPLVSVFVTVFVTLVAVGPVFVWAENAILGLMQALLTLPFGIGSFIVGLFYAPTVVTGIHQMYTAIDLGQLAQYGVTYWLPIASAANIAQGGAALAVAFKTRDAKIKGLALPSALSAFMGITEPAIFGVNLRFFKPFIAGCIGGGCGALVCALTSLAASGTGVTGIFGILLCLAQPVQYAIMFAVAALVSFAVSFVLYKDEPKASEQA